MDTEPMFVKLNKMGRKLDEGLEEVKQLEGKNMLLLVGPTGSGKSTIANALILGAENINYDEERDSLTVD